MNENEKKTFCTSRFETLRASNVQGQMDRKYLLAYFLVQFRAKVEKWFEFEHCWVGEFVPSLRTFVSDFRT